MTAKDKTICLIPGDGVGKEVIPVAAELLAALGLAYASLKPQPDSSISRLAERRSRMKLCPKWNPLGSLCSALPLRLRTRSRVIAARS
jgi:hypothetical protein